MSAIEPQAYEHYGLAEKYAWVNGRPGLRAVEAAADSVRTMGRKLDEITTAAGAGMRDLGVSWAGPASDAAQQSSKRIVDRASRTQSLADNGADRILDYGHSFDEMRRRIAFEDPRQLSWVELAMEPSKYAWDNRPWAAGEDHVSIVTRNQQHDAAANDALRWHEANARRADDGFVTDGVDPGRTPFGATDTGSAAAGGSAAVGGAGAAPPTVTAAASAPPGVASPSPPAIPAPPPGGGAAPVAAAPSPLPVAAGAGPNGPVSGTGPGASGAGTGTGGSAGTGTGGGGSAATGAGTTGPAGAAPDAAGQRDRLNEGFRRDLTASSPAGRSGAGAAASLPDAGGYGVPGGGRYGAGGSGAGSSGTGRYGTGVPGSERYGAGGPGSERYGAGGPGTGWRTGAPASGWAYGGSGTGGRGLLPCEAGPRGGAGGGLRSGLPGEGAWGRAPGEQAVGRPAAVEPGAVGRSGSGYGPGYGPMMGGAGGARSGDEEHRNRYLLPSSEPFDVDVPHSPPVLTPDEEG